MKSRVGKVNGKQAAELTKYALQVNVHGALRAGVELVCRRQRKSGTSSSAKLRVELRVRRKKVRGKGQYQSVGPQVRLQAAFDKETRNKSLARKYQLGPKAIARNSRLVAGIYLQAQLEWLRQIAQVCRSRAPIAAFVSRKWDETKELVTVKVGEKLERDEFEILVGNVRLVLAWSKHPKAPLLCFDLVQPPVPLVGNASPHLYAAMFSHPMLKPIHEVLREILSCALHKGIMWECDGASGNDKLHAFVSQCDQHIVEGLLQELHLCSNHQHHISTLLLVDAFKLDLLNANYAATIFLGSNGHWLRARSSIKPWVEKYLNVCYTPVPNDARQYALQFRNFIVRNQKYNRTVDADAGPREHQEEDAAEAGKRARDFDCLMDVLNGRWWLDDVVHHCKRDGSCCPGRCDAERAAAAKAKATRAIEAALFSSRPKRASSNKWNKVLGSFDFFVIGMAPHNLIRKIVGLAMQSLKIAFEAVKVKLDAAVEAARQMDVARQQELNFQAVTGTRLLRTLTMLDDDAVAVAHRMLLVISETSRTLSFYFQVVAEGRLRHNHPHLFDLARPEVSPVVACEQFYAGLLAGASWQMLRVIWQPYGSFRLWVRARPGQFVLFRRATLLVASSVRRRHGHYLEAPYSLTALADERTPENYKQQVLRNLASKLPCCHRPGMARDLRKRPLDWSGDEARVVLFAMALTFSLSLSDTERQHAANKGYNSRAGGGALFHQFAASSVCRLARAVLSKRAVQHKEHEAELRQLRLTACEPAAPLAVAVGGSVRTCSAPCSSDSIRRPRNIKVQLNTTAATDI